MSGRGPLLRIPTAGGSITIGVALAADVCSACPRIAALEATIDVEARDDLLELPLCGDCLAEALAVHLGRAHIRHGGRLADLTSTPPPDDDPLDLDRRLRP